MLSCMASTFCGNAKMDDVQSSGIACRQFAEETAGICVNALKKQQSVDDYTREVKGALESLLPTKHISASTYVTIKDLIENNKLKKAMVLASEMDDLALECAKKSKEITEMMQKGVDSLPDPVKHHVQDEDRETDDEDEETMELLSITQDTEDLETCTRSIKRTNFFSMTGLGVDAFQGLCAKEELCQTMFGKIKEFAISIVRLTEAFMSQNCCAQISAVVSNTNDLIKCIRLSVLMSKIAEAVRKLIQAIIRFMQAVWERIERFAEEFQAANKIKSFIVQPFKSSRIGKRINQGMDWVGK